MGMGKKWSEDEKELLSELWGKYSVPTIARKMNRSKNAIYVMKERLGLGSFLMSGGYVSVLDIAKAMGVEYSIVSDNWIGTKGLPCHTVLRDKSRIKHVYIDEFWEWAEKHREIIDFSRLQKNTLPPEPEWVDAQRKNDYIGKRKKTAWTHQELETLNAMIKQGKNTYEVAQRLSRTEQAVRRKMMDIGLGRKCKKAKNTSWTNKEILTLLRLRAEGVGWEIVGEKLGRSAQACIGRMERMCNPEYFRRESRNSREALKDSVIKGQCSNYDKYLGCKYYGTDCDSCERFVRLKNDEKQQSGYVSPTSYDTAKKLLEEMEMF